MRLDAACRPDQMKERGWDQGWYVVPIEVRFRDLDYFGHVNNAVYLTYFETARAFYWFDLTGRRSPGGIDFIVARAECDYREQIGLETIEVRVRVAEMRNTSMDFVYEIRKSGGERLAATGKVVVVMFDWKLGTKVPIPIELRREVERLQGLR